MQFLRISVILSQSSLLMFSTGAAISVSFPYEILLSCRSDHLFTLQTGH